MARLRLAERAGLPNDELNAMIEAQNAFQANLFNIAEAMNLPQAQALGAAIGLLVSSARRRLSSQTISDGLLKTALTQAPQYTATPPLRP